jgi:hypothetical protein
MEGMCKAHLFHLSKCCFTDLSDTVTDRNNRHTTHAVDVLTSFYVIAIDTFCTFDDGIDVSGTPEEDVLIRVCHVAISEVGQLLSNGSLIHDAHDSRRELLFGGHAHSLERQGEWARNRG